MIGDNGAGKSTLIKALCGAVTPDSGEILLDGKPVHFKSPMEARLAGIETVYYNLALSPALLDADNMFLGRERRASRGSSVRSSDASTGPPCRRRRAKLSELGLMTIQNIGQAVEMLSGGQRQGRGRPRGGLSGRRSSSWTSRPRRLASRSRAASLS